MHAATVSVGRANGAAHQREKTMKKFRTDTRRPSDRTAARRGRVVLGSVVAVTVLLASACGATTQSAGSASPSPVLRPKVVAQNKLTAPGVTGTFDIVQQVVEYPSGSFGVQHTHAGPVLIGVLDGEMTVKGGSGDSKVSSGQSLTEVPGKVYQTGNSGSAPAKWVADIFVPAGGAVSTPVPGASPVGPLVNPTVAYKWAGLSQSGAYDLVQVIQEFEPGAWTQRHKHGGNGVITVIEGQLTFRNAGTETVYKAGDTFREDAGQVLEGGNVGTTKTRTVASFVLPMGAELTTPVN
jgi:quercetin dioxygenase-like cupin family protein